MWTKKLVTEGKDFLTTLLSVAKQPVPIKTSPGDYSMIQNCDFKNGTKNPKPKSCEKFKQAKTNPYYWNCLTFNDGDDEKPQLFNHIIGPNAGLIFVIDFLRPGINVKQKYGALILHEPGVLMYVTY
jgi:hypothetical protein